MLESTGASLMLVKGAAVRKGGCPLLFLLACWQFQLAHPIRAGELEQFFYSPVSGATAGDFTAAPEFPERPIAVTPVNWFQSGLEGITNAAVNRGSWLRGYLEAPVTGDYTFYLSADDRAEFYLSKNELAANRLLTAGVTAAVPYGIYHRAGDAGHERLELRLPRPQLLQRSQQRPARPRLKLINDRGQRYVTWPASYWDFTLYFVEELATGMDWEDMAEGILSATELRIPISGGDQQLFFQAMKVFPESPPLP